MRDQVTHSQHGKSRKTGPAAVDRSGAHSPQLRGPLHHYTITVRTNGSPLQHLAIHLIAVPIPVAQWPQPMTVNPGNARCPWSRNVTPTPRPSVKPTATPLPRRGHPFAPLRSLVTSCYQKTLIACVQITKTLEMTRLSPAPLPLYFEESFPLCSDPLVRCQQHLCSHRASRAKPCRLHPQGLGRSALVRLVGDRSLHEPRARRRLVLLPPTN